MKQDFRPVDARVIAALVAVLAALLAAFKVPVNSELKSALELLIAFMVYGPLHKWLSKHHVMPPTVTFSQPATPVDDAKVQ